MNRFIILSAPRSGSTYLRFLLRSHRNIYMGAELFNDNPEYAKRHDNFLNKHAHIRRVCAIEYLQTFFCQERSDNITHIGFSLFYDQAHSKTERCIWRALADMPELSVIHLRRLNVLRNLVSLRNAQSTKKWLRRADEPLMNYSPITLDYVECLDYFVTRRNEIRNSNDLFETSRMVSIAYERLLSNKTRELRKLLTFLNLDYQKLTSVSQIQNRQKLSDLVLNYDELREKFSHSEWESYFED